MRKSNAWKMSYGGVMAAVAVVIMCLGTLIPISTFACPVLCCLIAGTVLRFCGKRVAWAWYAVLAVLSLLFAPDKEAAVVYVMLGNYPMLKENFDKLPFGIVVKLLYFNASLVFSYSLLMRLLGLSAVLTEYSELGFIGFVAMSVAANTTFLLIDILLKRISVRGKLK